ncbi:MAG: hypothetical protein HY904_10765 [Deltaproteobacteria bacterium]|nr:hypothetical protein [Deltaproteobacteria bacterium]
MTRAQVTAAIPEQERFLDGAPLRAFYCEKRLVISYGDTADGGGVLAGTLSNDDVVVRIHTLAGFAGRTDTDIALGDADTEIGTAYAAETSHAQVLSTVLGGAQELYPARGLAFGINGSSVAWMAVHRGSDGTLTPTPVNARLNLAGNAIGTGQDVKAAFTAGTTFATVKQKLGSLPDAAGTITYNSQQVAYLTYASLGLRVVGTPQGSTLDEATTFQIYITPPFAGFDSTTLGLGSSKAEFDTQFGTPSQQNVNGAIFYKYETGSGLFPPAIGVGYATDDACVERAAVIVLNFVTL